MWSVKFLLLCLILLTVDARRRRKKCNVALDCEDKDGRTVCWSHNCHKNIPCNKNDDCYFYGSANVPRFHCYLVPGMPWPRGYGTCVEETIGDKKFEPLQENLFQWYN